MARPTDRFSLGNGDRTTYGDRVWPATQGYDLVAPVFDDWHWRSFWLRNERPIIATLLEKAVEPLRSLDVGCGTGDYCGLLSNLCDVVGLDPSLHMLRQAQRRAPQASFVCGRAGSLPFRDDTSDIIVAARSLSHELDLEGATNAFARTLRRNGLCIISDVHPQHAYTHTRVPLGEEDVYIETIKRSPTDIVATAMKGSCWALEYQREFGWNDLLWAPDDERFSRIDRSGQRGIFFVIALRRI